MVARPAAISTHTAPGQTERFLIPTTIPVTSSAATMNIHIKVSIFPHYWSVVADQFPVQFILKVLTQTVCDAVR